jgi:RNA recognition motif-containing protein
MSSPDEAQKAIADLDGHDLHGRAIKVSEAREREGGGGGGDRNRRAGGGSFGRGR